MFYYVVVGGKHPKISTEVLEVEEFVGIWVRNKKTEAVFKINKDGSAMPEEEQKPEKVDANVLIPWKFIKGILVLEDERTQVVKTGAIGF